MKNLLKILLSTIIGLTLITPTALCLASPLYNSDLQTSITLDPSLKPDNSPGVIIPAAKLTTPGSEAYFANYVLQVMAGALISIAAPVAIIVIAVAGLYAVTSNGDPAKAGKVKKIIQAAITGLIIIIFAWVIVRATINVVITTNSNQPAGSSSAATEASPASGLKGDTSQSGF